MFHGVIITLLLIHSAIAAYCFFKRSLQLMLIFQRQIVFYILSYIELTLNKKGVALRMERLHLLVRIATPFSSDGYTPMAGIYFFFIFKICCSCCRLALAASLPIWAAWLKAATARCTSPLRKLYTPTLLMNSAV